MNSPVIGSLLRSLSELQATLVRVNRIAALQRIYLGVVPRELGLRSKVVLQGSGPLLVVAETSAVASKLRQLAPRVLEEIVKFSPEVTAIQVEVQVTLSSDLPPNPRARIGARGLSSLSHLRDTLPQSPLRDALDRMVRRGLRSDRQDQSLEREKSDDDQCQD